jgi:hypothetical protein
MTRRSRGNKFLAHQIFDEVVEFASIGVEVPAQSGIAYCIGNGYCALLVPRFRELSQLESRLSCRG